MVLRNVSEARNIIEQLLSKLKHNRIFSKAADTGAKDLQNTVKANNEKMKVIAEKSDL